MNFNFSPEIILSAACLAISLVIAGLGLRLRIINGAKSLAALNLIVIVCASANILSLLAGNNDLRWFFGSFQFVFGGVGGVLFIFAYRYCFPQKPFSRKLLFFFMAEFLVTAILALTDRFHPLMRQNLYLLSGNPSRLVPAHYGAWYWIDVVFGLLMYLVAAGMLTQTLIRTPQVYRRQVTLLLAGLVVPAAGMVLVLSGITKMFQVEYFLAVLSVTNILLAWGVFTRQFASIMPFAHDLIFLSSTQGSLVVGEDFKILDANPAALELLERSQDSVIGSDLTAILPVDPAQVAPASEPALAQRVQLGERNLLVFFSPVRNPWEQLVGWLVMLHDFTEFSRLQAALQESEQKYRSVSDNAMDGIVIIQEGLVRYANQRLLEMRGEDNQAVINQPFTNFVAPDYRAEVMNHYLSRVGGQSGPELYETCLVRKDDSLISVEISASRIEYKGLSAVVAFVRDITDRKKTELELDQVQGRYRNFIEQSLDGFILIDETLRVVEWNKAMQAISGLPRERVFGKPFAEVMYGLVPPEGQVPGLLEQIGKSLSDSLSAGGLPNDALFMESLLCREDGTRRLTQQVVSPIHGDAAIQLGITVRDVTDLKQAEINVRESEQRFRSLADAAPVMIWMADREGTGIYFNRPWEQFTGHTVDELMAFGWTAFVHPDDLLLVWETIKQADREGRGFNLEVRFRRADGLYRWLLVSASIRTAFTGALTGFTASCVDITDQKEREFELRGLTRAIEQSPVVVVITDLKGDIEYVNPRFCELTGYTSAEVIGKNPRILKSGEMSGKEYARLWSTISKGGEWHGVLHNKKKNGDLYWERATISCITDTRGQPTHYLAVKEDITAQTLVEQDLRIQQARLESVVNNPLIGIGLSNKLGRYTYVNQRLAGMLGYTVEQLLGKSIQDVTHPEDQESTRALNLALYDGTIDQFKQEKRFIRKDGVSFWGEVTCMPVDDQNGSIQEGIGFITDISEGRAIQEKLRASEELYRSVINASPDIITITDLDGRIRYASPVSLRSFGYNNLDDWVGLWLVELIVPEDRPVAMENMEHLRLHYPPEVVEYRCLRRDGSIFHLEVNSDVLRGQDGRPEGFVFIARDISARKEMEAEQHRRMAELEALHETMNDVTSELELSRLLEAIVGRVMSLLGAAECEVALYDEAKDILRTVVSVSRDKDYTGVELKIGEGIMGRAAQLRKTIFIEDYATWEGRSPKFSPVHRAVISVPLINNQKLLGVIAVGADPGVRIFALPDIRLIEMFCQQAAIAIQNAELYAKVKHLAVTDALTGLNNRGAFFDRARQEFNRSVRYGHKMSVIMLDVDHFKQVNDKFGHAAGDEALRLIARLCQGIIRDSDVAGRYGGEEFVILLPETGLNGAISTAQRLCEQIASSNLQSERGTLRMTASIGIAELTADVLDLEVLLDKADQALYRAKQAGRNRVAI
jgi:diguanylate cyclase (GGDEF)-like protein/PAS domain S-box-containing protein